MPGRIRNTKRLAQRIDRRYLKKLFPIPLWRRILTGICVGIGLLWVGFYAIARNPAIYVSGPLTPAHSFLSRNCETCHGGKGFIGKRVADQRCAGCHNAPLHNALQTSNPACSECHMEHRGAMMLAAGASANCTSCHSNLAVKSGTLSVAASVSDFGNHPEFRAVRNKLSGTGIKFNHQKHVGELDQKCDACHTPVASVQQHSHVSQRALMKIPSYAETCAPCHALTIDDKITDAAPHDKPAVVHQAVVSQLTKYIAAHPGDLGKDGTPGNAAAWIKFKIAADEKTMWETTCARCHTMLPSDSSGLPGIAPSAIPARWFSRATFDHAAHQELTCESCHAGVKKSTTSTEVVLPGIEVCQRCHTSGTASAGAECSTCHVYHDWTKEKGVEGKMHI